MFPRAEKKGAFPRGPARSVSHPVHFQFHIISFFFSFFAYVAELAS